MKRLIFSLLYDSGAFILSRNFRRQKIGTLNWLMSNYNFQEVSLGLDEILLLNISENDDYHDEFLTVIRSIAERCFIPLTIGGKITDVGKAEDYFLNGADKVFLNNSLFHNPKLANELGETYGKQAVVGGINFIMDEGIPVLCDSKGLALPKHSFSDHLKKTIEDGVGELVLQSVDRDGTGNGLETNILDHIPNLIEVPLVLCGGIGKAEHIINGLQHENIDAVATANLLNFIGQSFVSIRNQSIKTGVMLPEFTNDIIL